MNSFLKADIFFFVTTIAVVVFTAVLIVAAVYAIRILRNMEDISEKVKKEGGEIMDDVKELTGKIKNEGEEIVGDVDEFRKKIKKQKISLKNIGKFFGFFKEK